MARLVLPPTVEPMTVADVRLRLKYPRTDQDAAIVDWIASARNAVERYVERGLMTQTWEMQLLAPTFGQLFAGQAVAGGESTESHRDFFAHNLTTIRTIGPKAATSEITALGYVDLLWAAPLQAVESVTDEAGVLPASAYVIDATMEPARLWWVQLPVGTTTIRYRVGYGDVATDVPANLRQVCFALVQQFFLYRSGPPPVSALDATLAHADGYRVRTFA
jgi:hypothetical protein